MLILDNIFSSNAKTIDFVSIENWFCSFRANRKQELQTTNKVTIIESFIAVLICSGKNLFPQAIQDKHCLMLYRVWIVVLSDMYVRCLEINEASFTHRALARKVCYDIKRNATIYFFGQSSQPSWLNCQNAQKLFTDLDMCSVRTRISLSGKANETLSVLCCLKIK